MPARRTAMTLLVAAVAALLLAAALPAAYATRIVKVRTRVSISTRHGFHGKVESGRGCVAGRTVVLKLQAGHGKPAVLRRGTSRANGRWRLKAQGFGGPPPLAVFVRVKPFSDGTLGTIYKCSGATSRKVELGT